MYGVLRREHQRYCTATCLGANGGGDGVAVEDLLNNFSLDNDIADMELQQVEAY